MTNSPRPKYPVTLDEYEQLPDESHRDELVRGRVVREPLPGAEHDRIAGRVFLLLVEHGQRTGKGEVTFGAGYQLSEDTVRGPDVGFISRERLPAETPTGWWPLAPDLAVEVLSRSNRVSAMNEKVLQYLEAGTRLVWVIDPRTRIVTVHHSLREVVILRADDRLSGAPVVPELDITVSELFD